MAHGTPSSLDEMEEYLQHIRGGRPASPGLVTEMRRRYALVGRSPLLDISLRQAHALEERLNATRSGQPIRVYVGMRHWHPFIADTVRQMADDGVKQVVAFCLVPHYSRLSVGAYFRTLQEAVETTGAAFHIAYVESWHTNPHFLQAIVDQTVAARARFAGSDRVFVVFTAHSLPESTLAEGDPYDSQVRETARLLADRLGLAAEDWQFSYQSAGATAGPWLGPQINQVIEQLAAAGRHQVLVVPIGFVADHVEILYDLDIDARSVAERVGVHFERTDSLNVTPAFIEALADVVSRVGVTL